MGIIEDLVTQSGRPSGLLGRLMVKIMNHMDSGINKWVIEKVNYPTGTALDIGCGGGETIINLLKKNQIKNMIGIDYSLDAVTVTCKRISAFIKKQRANVIQGNVNALPFTQNYFDIILAVRSHYFWDNYEEAFSEIYRTLKPCGKIFIFSERYKIKYHMKKYNSDESMKNLLQTTGFHDILIENRAAIQCITAIK
jgi:ubiquinone/menaquinone biosynthesis C-methylase UbiE